MKLWVDAINPSHVLFFKSLLGEFEKKEYIITLRDRAETVELAEMLGMGGQTIGSDSKAPILKIFRMFDRTVRLYLRVNDFDYALSFENGSSVVVSRAHGKKSILMCDNDLKFLQSTSLFQSMETYLKTKADYIVVPEACGNAFKKHATGSEVFTFPGFKEDIYIADYVPDPHFRIKIPFDRFVILRPEALGSFYVKEEKSLVPELLKLFNKEGINVVYLPRDKGDMAYVSGFDVFVPPKATNGLDLCYYADAVLTGSGTMAREAACMGKTAVSFFPSERLLSVDQELVNQGMIFHSRKPQEIMNHVVSNINSHEEDLGRSKKVKDYVLSIIKGIVGVS